MQQVSFCPSAGIAIYRVFDKYRPSIPQQRGGRQSRSLTVCPQFRMRIECKMLFVDCSKGMHTDASVDSTSRRGELLKLGPMTNCGHSNLRYFPDSADTLDLADCSSRVDSMLHYPDLFRICSHLLPVMNSYSCKRLVERTGGCINRPPNRRGYCFHSGRAGVATMT